MTNKNNDNNILKRGCKIIPIEGVANVTKLGDKSE